MASPRLKPIPALIAEIRRAARRLDAVGDAVLAETRLTAATGDLLAEIAELEAVTVSDLARRRRVSRQNIQALADRLVALRLLRPADNPRHRRSPLMVMTDLGRDMLRGVGARQAPVGAALAAAVTPAEATSAAATLARLSAALDTD